MAKIDKTVKTETLYIAVWVLILSLLMQAVFLIIGKWDYTVVLGNLLSGVAAVGNFFLMALSVQKALGKDEKDAKNHMRLSYSYRMLLIGVLAVVAALVPCFNIWAGIIPYIFPRIGIMFRQIIDKK